MTPDAIAASPKLGDISARWREATQSQLRPEENVLAALEVDLDAKLNFVGSLVVITNGRVLSRNSGDTRWLEWPFRAGLELRHHDQDRKSNV